MPLNTWTGCSPGMPSCVITRPCTCPYFVCITGVRGSLSKSGFTRRGNHVTRNRNTKYNNDGFVVLLLVLFGVILMSWMSSTSPLRIRISTGAKAFLRKRRIWQPRNSEVKAVWLSLWWCEFSRWSIEF